jgi:hypothetical protein
MSTIYQQAVAGTLPTKETVLALKAKEEKDKVNAQESWNEWAREYKTQQFVRRLEDIVFVKQETQDLNILAGNIDKDQAYSRSLEIAVIHNIIKLINTGNY